METTESIRNIIALHKLSQSELGAILGIDHSQTSRYISGEREPNTLPCLLLSALAGSKEEAEFWVSKSGVNHKQIALLGKLLALHPPEILAGEEHELLDWWRTANTGIEDALKHTIQQLLKLRRKG